jgi:tRNA-specific 2-thiouridylase
MARSSPARRRTVAVAMSGGVDSSVAAALLREAGHDVVGVMLRLWAEPGAAGANKCCTLGAINDARAVADRLDIPFSVLDAGDVFERLVVDPFLADSAAGLTPNPCFGCNRRVRFRFLLEQALALGADALATGHYARVVPGLDGGLELRRGLDAAKDQSYMLHRLGQHELAHALFPVGGYRKAEVRALAARFGLPVAERADSVDLCWVGEGGVAGFLARRLPAGSAEPGPILDAEGRVLGAHAGLAFYTLGQRRGLGVALGEPVYVVERDAARNALVVGPAEALGARVVRVRALHWVSGRAPEPETDGTIAAEAQIRYRAPAAAARLRLGADGAGVVTFDEPQRAPTPGQGLVLYRGEVVLGGGEIV